MKSNVLSSCIKAAGKFRERAKYAKESIRLLHVTRNPDNLELDATDHEAGIKVQIPAMPTTAPTTTRMIDPAALEAILPRKCEADICVNGAIIVTGEGSNNQIGGAVPIENITFPTAVPRQPGQSFDGKGLARILNFVLPAVGDGSGRYANDCVALLLDENEKIVGATAVDGRRQHLIWAGEPKFTSELTYFLLPPKVAKNLIWFLEHADEVVVEFWDGWPRGLVIHATGMDWSMRAWSKEQGERKYPEWSLVRDILSPNYSPGDYVKFQPRRILGAVKRAADVAGDKAVKFTFSGNILSLENHSEKFAFSACDLESPVFSRCNQVVFLNPRFFLDAIRSFGTYELISFCAGGKDCPAIFIGERGDRVAIAPFTNRNP